VKQLRENPPTTRRREDRRVWAALGVILVLYVFSALRVGPISNFGVERDDATYFSAAKALSSGQGYILPSFPVRLAATKYPELYPLLLTGVWKLDPHFPGNVMLAADLTLGFGCLALLFAFLLLRRWPGLGDWQALAVVALCAFTGYFLDLSASVLTDVPFMALTLGAIWLAEGSSDAQEGTPVPRRWSGWAVLGAGLLAGLSLGFRSLGAAVVAGIGLAFLARREYRQLFWFSLSAGPVSLVWLRPALMAMAHPTGPRLAVGPNASGWTQTLCYYTSYACNWGMDVSGPGALRAVVTTNLKGVIQQPGLYLLHPLATRPAIWSLVLVTLVSLAAYAGIVRYARASGWQAFPVAFLFYLLIIVPWPYTPDRFLVVFQPLFFGGLWLEGRHFVALVGKHLRPPHTIGERVTAAVMAVAGVALAATVAVNYAYAIPSKVAELGEANAKLLADKRGAYDWIREHAAPDARIIAYQDGLAYLYTGRPSIAPISCLTQAFYLQDPRYAEHDAAHLDDVARYIGASYWLASKEDFRLDGDTDYVVLQKRQKQLLAGSPLAFQSADGMIKLYDVRCLTGAEKEGCGGGTAGDWGGMNAGRKLGAR
jgi:hypothetical protein